MYQYDSPVHAIEELKKRGYSEDFNLKDNCIVCNSGKFGADGFEIKENELKLLLKECNEICRILASSILSLKKKY